MIFFKSFLISVFFTYFAYCFLSSLLLQIIYRKKCTGSTLTDGCGKMIKPYIFKNLYFNILFRNAVIIVLTMFNKKKANEMEKNPKYRLQYEKKFKGIDFEIGGNAVYGYCCKDCLERHEAVEIAIKLTEEV